MACVEDGECSHTPDHRVLVFKKGYVPLGPDHPVINVSYLDALEYVAWLNGRVGAEVYRLPTEAEWEYAARAGTQTRFAQGDELTADQANFSRTATEYLRQLPKRVELPHLTNRRMPVSVHELDAANAWGLRHMSGNVLEVTMSCWTDEHLGLASDSAYLRLARSQTECQPRVGKGGSFAFAMDLLRLAARIRPLETRRDDQLGFRIIREMKKGERND
jgi:formylglycine-generating enzyme required for sulfatase activity